MTVFFIKKKSNYSIFIPLCSTLSSKIAILHLFLWLYIPLYFYFINIWYCQEHVDYKRLIEKFTFHYASTLSVESVGRMIPDADLHSIMLLLYRWLFSSLHFKIIYIPLCFYFIALTSLADGFASAFTFHYASTLS